MLILLVFVTIRAFPYLNQCLLHIYYNITSKNKASCLTPCFFLKGFLILWGFFLILFSIEYDKVFGYYSIGSHLSVMLLQSNLMPFRLAVYLLYCAPTLPFFGGGGGLSSHHFMPMWGRHFVFVPSICPFVLLTVLHAHVGKAFCFCPVHLSVCPSDSTSCPCGEGILFLSRPSVRLSFWHHKSYSSYILKQNLNYVCLIITVWRITYHYSLHIGQNSFKLCMLAYYRMENHISLQPSHWTVFVGVIALCFRIFH